MMYPYAILRILYHTSLMKKGTVQFRKKDTVIELPNARTNKTGGLNIQKRQKEVLLHCHRIQ